MFFILSISIVYFLLIGLLIIGFDKVRIFNLPKKQATQGFTIIIPFRNEADNLIALLNSLSQINYNNNLYEIIFVNDHSTDNSVPLLTEYLIKNTNWKLLDNIRLSNSPKKDAINTAIQKSKFKWILTTDADCIIPQNWLQCYTNFIICHSESKLKMIVGAVAYKTNSSFLQNFQNLDFLSLIGSTIGGFGIKKPFLCNGANLCYQKETFLAVNGFEGNNNIASGDDIFLMEKFLSKNQDSVHYLKSTEALVITKPVATFKGLLSQRIRWASKIGATKNWFGKLVGVLVFLMNLVSLWFLVFGLWFSKYKLLFLVIFILKIIIDFVIIRKTASFLKQKNNLFYYLLSAIFYPFFVVSVVLLSTFKGYEWKGRKFKDN